MLQPFRIEHPVAVHHLTRGGIEKKAVCKDCQDRDDFPNAFRNPIRGAVNNGEKSLSHTPADFLLRSRERSG
jgi:hypothetical protein